MVGDPTILRVRAVYMLSVAVMLFTYSLLLGLLTAQPIHRP